MNTQKFLKRSIGVLFTVVAAHAAASIPIAMATGPVTVMPAKNGVTEIKIGGTVYRASPSLVVNGAKSLQDVPARAVGSATIDPDGTLRSLTVTKAPTQNGIQSK
ncbi:MAG: hypothetical protein JWM78_3646 [Verrucomicrobiaceae bacterium]|nr:hypothetical protein [Verrucomicrobiaceae bacterium]